MSDFLVLFGQRLKEARLARGLTQDELATRAGTSKGRISDYEKGKNDPRQSVLGKMAEALNVPVVWLMGLKSDFSLNNEITAKNINKIVNTCKELSEDGQKKVITYANDIKPKYSATTLPTPTLEPIIEQPMPPVETTRIDNTTELTLEEPETDYDFEEVIAELVRIAGFISAGEGYMNDDYATNIFYEVPSDDVPYNYDSVAMVQGDSMEPNFSDGDILFVSSSIGRMPQLGAVVNYQGRSYLKCIVVEDGKVILRSYNKKYADIEIEGVDLDDLRLIGYVTKITRALPDSEHDLSALSEEEIEEYIENFNSRNN